MADITLLGLDTSSSRSGYSVYRAGELVDYGCIDLKRYKGSLEQRRDEMCKSLLKLLKENNPDIVVIEEEVISSSTTTRLLSMIIGVVYAWTLSKNKEFHMIQPSQWRSIVSDGEGFPKKREDVKVWDVNKVKEIFGIDANDDVCDGILVGYSYVKKYKEY